MGVTVGVAAAEAGRGVEVGALTPGALEPKLAVGEAGTLRGKGVGRTTASDSTSERFSISSDGSQPRAEEPGGNRTASQLPD
jgi:hypothetical protein